MATTVARDPFARGAYERQSAGRGTCRWCGQERRVVFTYTWRSDDGSCASFLNERTYCNLECFRSYDT